MEAKSPYMYIAEREDKKNWCASTFHSLKVQYNIGKFKSGLSKISSSKYLDTEHGGLFGFGLLVFFNNDKCTFYLKIHVGQLYLASATAVVFILRRKQYSLPLLL